MTTVMSSPLAGAEMMTFLAPAARWPLAFSASVKRPVDSMTSCTPSLPHGQLGRGLGGNHEDFLAVHDRGRRPPALSAADFLEPTVPLKRPCVESYFSR
jgi:hypothetical protein